MTAGGPGTLVDADGGTEHGDVMLDLDTGVDSGLLEGRPRNGK